jgi:alpha-glucan,water dikinase
MLIKSVATCVQRIAGMPQWQIVSAGRGAGGVSGVVVKANIADVQHEVYTTPTVLVASSVSGEEEVPDGVVAVITPDAPDVLSHIAVRARNLRVLFATCFDSSTIEQLKQCEGKPIRVVLKGETVQYEILPDMKSVTADTTATASPTENVASAGANVKPYPFTAYCLAEKDIDPNKAAKAYGAKSSNLVALRALLPSFVQVLLPHFFLPFPKAETGT